MGAGDGKRALDLGQDLSGVRLLLAGQLGDQADLPRPALLGLGHIPDRGIERGLSPAGRHDQVGWIARRCWRWSRRRASICLNSISRVSAMAVSCPSVRPSVRPARFL